jgi:hypothetical protein
VAVSIILVMVATSNVMMSIDTDVTVDAESVTFSVIMHVLREMVIRRYRSCDGN